MNNTTYPNAGSNVPVRKTIEFKFFLNGSSAPTWTAADNLFVSNITREAQGQYRVHLADTFRRHIRTNANVNVNAGGTALFAQPGPVSNVGTSTPVYFDIFTVNGSGTASNPPAANANNYISGEIVFSDTSGI